MIEDDEFFCVTVQGLAYCGWIDEQGIFVCCGPRGYAKALDASEILRSELRKAIEAREAEGREAGD
jgi:hypothetical protein